MEESCQKLAVHRSSFGRLSLPVHPATEAVALEQEALPGLRFGRRV